MRLSLFVWHHQKAVLLLVFLLCALGLYFSRHLPVAIFPDLTAPRIIITADSGDTPIPTMLANVTRPLENAVAGVPSITRIKSLTQRGGDELDVNFNWGTDMLVTLQLVQARIGQIQQSLPPGTQVQSERLNPSVFPIMGYSLYSSTIPPAELRRIALYTMRPRMLRVPGVREISVLGGDQPDFLVTVDPTELLARGVSVRDVEDGLSKTNQISSVGYYDAAFLHHQIIVSGLLKNPRDIARVTVAVKNRVPVTVGQVATVQRAVEKRTIETSGDGHDAVLVNVIKQPNGNTVQVAQEIRRVLRDLQPALPPGLRVTVFYDQSEIVQESQASVLEAILLGSLLALVVLMFFLGNLRAAAVVLIILPLSILITFGLMKALGQTMNIMTLGALAIALGLVIDDGIVVVENMFHELERGQSRRAAIAVGLQGITPAMVGSSLTTMAAFLPLTFLSGITGQFFGPLALVMIATLFVSLLLSLLFTPLLADILLPKEARAPGGGDPRSGGAGPRGLWVGAIAKILGFFPGLFEHVVRVYTRILGWSLRHRALVILLLAPIAGGTFLLFNHVQTGFFPEFDEGGFIVDYLTPAGTSLAETSVAARQVESILARTPEVAAWSRRTGAQLGFDITTQNRGDMSVRLRQRRSRDIQAIMDDVRRQVEAQVPSVQADFIQILQDGIGDIAGSPRPVEVKIFGEDMLELEKLARQVGAIVAGTPGVVDENDGIVNSSPETVLSVDTERAQRFGLTTEDIRQATQAALLGVEPTSIQEGEQAVGVRVVLAHPYGALDQAVLPHIPIASPVTNGDILLSQVADVRSQPGTPLIRRENQRQMIAVTAGLSGRDLGSATADIQQRIARQVRLPAGDSIEYGGLYESQQQSFAGLATVLVVAVLFVVTLLVIQLRSLRQSFALLVAAILSLSGVLLGLFLTQTPLNISSFTGAIMIVGIVTENGIVLFDFMNRLHQEAPGRELTDVIAQAGTERLRPILMTTIAAILALFPLALGLGAGAALQRPLAIAVIGGLSVSIFFTLLAAPVLYVTLERLKPRRPPAAEERQLLAVEHELVAE